jgi:conjugal transfer/entry exclusion protein
MANNGGKEKGCVKPGSARLRAVTRRCLFMPALGLAIAAVAPLPAGLLTPRVVKATFGEDVAVLLAQLEQQLQLVSNAISTVQNLVQTVQHLANVVQNGKQLLEKATSKGGLKMIAADLTGGQTGINGILTAAQSVTGLAQDTVQDLNVIGDAIYDDWGKWQSNSDLCAGKADKDCPLLVSARLKESSAALARADSLRLRSIASIARSFKGLRKMYDVGKESNQIAVDAQTERGVVGEMQLVSRQLALQTSTTIKGNEMMAITAQMEADRYAQEAQRRELDRAAKEAAWKDMEFTPDPPVDTGWEFSRTQWETR